MATVDPYVIKLPDVITDSNGRPSEEFRAWLNYDNRWKHDIWIRTGGGDDAVVESQIGELYEPGIQTSNSDELIEGLEVSQEMQLIQDLLERVEELEAAQTTDLDIKKLESYTVQAGDTSFTTTADQFVSCLNTATATITLNLEPEDGEDVIIWRGAAAVTVVGSINGGSSLVIPSIYDAPHFKYSLDAGEWAIV
jgi:hypothetical protein